MANLSLAEWMEQNRVEITLTASNGTFHVSVDLGDENMLGAEGETPSQAIIRGLDAAYYLTETKIGAGK